MKIIKYISILFISHGDGVNTSTALLNIILFAARILRVYSLLFSTQIFFFMSYYIFIIIIYINLCQSQNIICIYILTHKGSEGSKTFHHLLYYFLSQITILAPPKYCCGFAWKLSSRIEEYNTYIVYLYGCCIRRNDLWRSNEKWYFI